MQLQTPVTITYIIVLPKELFSSEENKTMNELKKILRCMCMYRYLYFSVGNLEVSSLQKSTRKNCKRSNFVSSYSIQFAYISHKTENINV